MILNLAEAPAYVINLEESIHNFNHTKQVLNECGINNVHRTTGIRIFPYWIGVAMAHLSILQKIVKDNVFPAMVFEDDIDVTQWKQPVQITVPDNTDAYYLGISLAGKAREQSFLMAPNLYRVRAMLAAHAIVYVSRAYTERLCEGIIQTVFDRKLPFDIATAELQFQYNVFCPKYPYFLQSDAKNSTNKWQFLTDKPIKED